MREFFPDGRDYENCIDKTREAFRKYPRANEEAAAVATAAKSQSKNKR